MRLKTRNASLSKNNPLIHYFISLDSKYYARICFLVCLNSILFQRLLCPVHKYPTEASVKGQARGSSAYIWITLACSWMESWMLLHGNDVLDTLTALIQKVRTHESNHQCVSRSPFPLTRSHFLGALFKLTGVLGENFWRCFVTPILNGCGFLQVKGGIWAWLRL